VLYQFFFTNINIFGVTDLIPGILVFVYGCVKCQISVSFFFIVQVIVMLIGATLIRGGIYILLGSTSFYTRSAVDFGQYTQEIMDKTTMYPISMYPEGMQLILTFLIPVGWVSFYPASGLLGIDNGLYNGLLLPLITLAVGIAVMLLAGVYFLILPTPKLLFAYGEQRELKQKIVKLLQIDHWQRITLAVNNQAVQILRNRQQPVFVLL
jgi:ABC-2 type transport system permease protein